ncbi:putative penicillin-binding protein 1A [Bradyrhizobium oligotrophicum S58]|uniref:Putative penicillin-binding protein 1A n=1 Tax=Bradyrhizobium oligotrophicum S58 TaxID=1245469 RepID=M4ZB58_9BRAD|nr:transglycosylase domain-containing protein [Bradyrhizobium oligotrophicum]BAM91004.1 putative penicillin-binding protein 1A [Bradyrhizobium oligotrophicum S58]
MNRNAFGGTNLLTMQRPRTKRLFILFGRSILAVLSLAVVLVLYAEGYVIWYFEYGLGLPTESQLAALPTTGPLCAANPGSSYVPLSEIPPLVRKAVVASEDRDFYERTSIGPLARLASNIVAGRRPGNSSIIHAVSRQCLWTLVPECCKGPNLEWQFGTQVFTGRIERTFTRDRILEAYLNNAYLGRGAYGAADAATAYFGKSLASLDIDEIALLLTRFRMPMTSRHDSEWRNLMLDRMLAAGLIDQAQATAAKAAPLSLIAGPLRKP